MRSLSLAHYLAEDGVISISGHNGEQLAVSATPHHFSTVRGINEADLIQDSGNFKEK